MFDRPHQNGELQCLLEQLDSASQAAQARARKALAINDPTFAIFVIGTLYDHPEASERVRCQLIAILADSNWPQAIPRLIIALEDPLEHIRLMSARGLAKQGQEGLKALLHAIAFEPHEELFYRSAHHSLFLLQFHAPMRDRAVIESLLNVVVGPNPSLFAPAIAWEAIQG